jgi:hypothetical protein
MTLTTTTALLEQLRKQAPVSHDIEIASLCRPQSTSTASPTDLLRAIGCPHNVEVVPQRFALPYLDRYHARMITLRASAPATRKDAR